MDTEEYFPRGGTRPPVQQFRQTANFLGKPEKVARKKKRTKKRSTDDGYQSDEFDAEYEASARSCATGLHFASLKEGTVVLGRVREALDTKLYVSLPSRLEGSVMACHVSEPHNKALQAYVDDKVDSVRELRTMFKRGQYVAVKVLETQHRQIMLSTMPQHVNAGWTHRNIKKVFHEFDYHSEEELARNFAGVLLQGAVSSVEDHGYVIDLGVPKVTVFLPKSHAHDDIDLDVGQLTWCAVKKSSAGAESGGGVVTVTNKLQSIQDSFIKYRESDNRTVNSILPGMAVEFIIDKALRNGIEGRIFNNITGYVQRYHTDTARAKKPRLGEKVRARLLYVVPTSKVPFFSMKNIFETAVPDLDREQRLSDGDIVDNAKVLAINQRSIIFKLGEHDTGMLNVKKVMVDEDLTDEDVISKSYPLGSVHRVRVMRYNLCDYTYSVSDDAAILNEKYFSWADISVGTIVDATVYTVNESNLVLSVGRLTGLVPQMHISDIGLFVDPKKASNTNLTKKKFKIGQQVKARVLIADRESNKLHLTLKPSLMDPDLEIITECAQAVVGKTYKGFVKYVDDKIIVGFFNNVTALIPPLYVSREPLPSLAAAFHVGQIVNCTILKVRAEKNKIIGSLTTAAFEPSAEGRRPKRKKENTEEDGLNKKPKLDVKTRISSDSSDNRSETATKKKKKEANSPPSVSDKVIEKNKRYKKISESSASDAIETDLPDETDESSFSILTSDDLALMNFDDCVTQKHFKKRIVSLKKAVNNRIRRVNVIESKIDALEEEGINTKNKKRHSNMKAEKIVTEERMKALLEALQTAQAKLKELGEDEVKNDYKRKKRDSTGDSEEKEINNLTQKEKSNKRSKKRNIEDKDNPPKIIEIKVADNTTPALELPSVKNFWSLNADTLAKNVNQEKEEISSSSDEEIEEQPKKKRKKLTAAEKVDKVRQEEERVRALERSAALDSNRPQSSDQFERLLLANPNSSELWIAYMAFYLQATEIDKARGVGRKALKTISFREEQEKLNVWLAMLNFENRFGTKESLEKTLEEALQMNDSFKIHSKLLEIYQETSKVDELTSLVDLMLKKYKREPTMYTMAGNALYKQGLIDRARSVMQRAISILEKKDHITVIVQFALMERSLGSSERAEALLEQVVGAYPQRTDVWSVYVDMLCKSNDIDNIRQVMERAVSHKMAARKMKVLYQKWIEVEEKIGNVEQVATIRQKALDFIEKAKF